MQKILSSLLLVYSLCACSPEGLETYQGETSLKFAHTALGKDSIETTFRSILADELIITQIVEVTGEVTNKPRSYKLQVDTELSSAIAGKNYAPLLDTFSIAAGANKDTVTIKLQKTADLDNRNLKIVLKLLPNEHFKLLQDPYSVDNRLVRYDSFHINFSNNYIIGPNWDPQILGKFSKKKLRLLCEVTQLDLLKFYVLWGYYPSHYLSFARTFSNYLRNQKAAGNTIYDEENQEEMQMGSAT